jgi:Cu(I)/Ag(I) efflux system membrane fusion protein
MKIKNVFVGILTLSFVVFAACSGNKKEATENYEGHDQMDHAKADVITPDEVKAFENVDVSIKTQLSGFLTDYFALNQALIEDNQDGAKAAAKKLSETINKFDMTKLIGEQMDFYHLQVAKLNEGLKGVSASTDIEETRTELSNISEGIYALVKAYHPNESALYVQFCPMAKNGAGATWVSNTNEIINPYMGQRMLKCGRTQETLN